MVRLKKKRTAFVLYSLLLVLPAVVLGGLHWHQIWLDYQAELDAVPEAARDAARRLAYGISENLSKLIDAESDRPFHHYSRILAIGEELDDSLSLYHSPLVRQELPQGVLAWFSYNLADPKDRRLGLFLGSETPDSDEDLLIQEPELVEAAERLMWRNMNEGYLRRAARLGQVETVESELVTIAVNRSNQEEIECFRGHMDLINGVSIPLNYSQFHLRFYEEKDGTPRALATRRVLMDELELDVIDHAPCLERLRPGFGLVQGLFLDPYWLFAELPVLVSDQVLSGSERFQDDESPRINPAAVKTEYRFPVSLVRTLGFEAASADTNIGDINVVIDEGEIESRFQAQMWRFFGVAAMLALTLGTGMALLVRSVNRELEQAQQTENFVAAVTHELRTPLSAIRLHAEMLLEGWVSDETKRDEYYLRIVRETGRLSTLVERVLEKARISSKLAKPEPGDLSELVGHLKPGLEQRAGGDGSDLDFKLEAELPPVMLVPEAVSSILDNLIENARKYARDGSGELNGASTATKIEVRTKQVEGKVVLEVADHGPGIPAEEMDHIFEAFYRVGNEGTRTSTGTGLGLHLVAIHAESMGGRATVQQRESGGALFRVSFRAA